MHPPNNRLIHFCSTSRSPRALVITIGFSNQLHLLANKRLSALGKSIRPARLQTSSNVTSLDSAFRPSRPSFEILSSTRSIAVMISRPARAKHSSADNSDYLIDIYSILITNHTAGTTSRFSLSLLLSVFHHTFSVAHSILPISTQVDTERQ